MLAPLLVAGLALAACSSHGDSSGIPSTTPVSSAPATSTPATPSASTTSSKITTIAEVALTILVTNDDGVGAQGIDTLVNELTASTDHEVIVVAPAEN